MSSTPSYEQTDLRYPIGRCVMPEAITPLQRHAAIDTLVALPGLLYTAVAGLQDEHLDTPYREGGWTIRQVVAHMADSHSIALSRVKMALTADWPVVPGYDEKLFAELPDASLGVATPLAVLEGTHARWAALLGSLGEEQWKRGFRHEERGPMSVEQSAILYSWHCRHHLAHITELRARSNW